MTPPRPRLTPDRIVDAACQAIDDEGLHRLSMRRLGARLGVDPMAVYHHVPNKRALLSLVMARVVGSVPLPDREAPWQDRVRQWAGAYWDVVTANRELVAAGLADPVIAEGAMPTVEPLRAAIADSGLPAELVTSNTYLVVDVVHGSALAAPQPPDGADGTLRQHFELGLDTVIAGIEALSRPRPPGRSSPAATSSHRP